jgi:D-amino-acid oxidase
MELWPQWAEELGHQEQPLQLQTPLVQVAATEEEGLRMQALAKERQSSGLRSPPRMDALIP